MTFMSGRREDREGWVKEEVYDWRIWHFAFAFYGIWLPTIPRSMSQPIAELGEATAGLFDSVAYEM